MTPGLPAARSLRVTLVARAGLALEGAFHRFAGLPYRVRRRGLKLFFTVLKPLGTGSTNTGGARIVSKVLALSARDARRFAAGKLFHEAIFFTEWAALGRRSVAGLIADSRHISTDGDEELRWLAAQRGAIIGTMHFGPYALGLVWLLHTYFQGRKVIIFKSDHDTDVEQRATARLAELGAQVEFVTPEAVGGFHQVIKAVRRGALVIIMIDLPPAFGRSDDIDLLGHRISLASGAVDLAALGQVPLMLLRVRSSSNGDLVEVGDMFDVARNDPASRARGVSRLGRFVGDTLHDHPDQWHMWNRFSEYLSAHEEVAS